MHIHDSATVKKLLLRLGHMAASLLEATGLVVDDLYAHFRRWILRESERIFSESRGISFYQKIIWRVRVASSST